MKSFPFILFALSLSYYQLGAQRAVEPAKRYVEKDILDSAEGIKMYTQLIGALGGDSVTHNRLGFNLQGWNEDFYKSGKLLHRGYYLDGKLVVFKNFYESGQCERVVENPDPLRCNVDIFFESGQKRKQILYYNGLPQKSYEFYENGLPKFAIENEKDLDYLKLKKSWYANGNLESSLELQDHKGKKYTQKTYYQNGQVKEEGTLLKLSGNNEYVKDGAWYTCDSSGKKKFFEKYSRGVKLSSN